ncbi:methyltransferase [Paenibacillus swuensis]|uniref:Methyltransferase n=1 Tax=Paenibacillus swuensis TaxID=1178515 RepID=A0A172TP21_9BACL|nr:class I SAM-dependent methyltransferase [Paenibacillus swuensis]ANE48801.1 methyltransferase [Paenibacillus swuensis]
MDNKERFSDRVDTYVKYRPSYPSDAIDYLYHQVGLSPNSMVADIGAGTGIFSKLLLARGSRVVAVEPNRNMREAAEAMLGETPNFHAVGGAAEATGLLDQSVDYIVCAQAFHWFDRRVTSVEFRRILRPGGKVVLIWNSRLTQGTPFLEAYEQMLQRFGTDYKQVNHKNISWDTLQSFFQKGWPQTARFDNTQVCDFDQLQGRLLSSSYCPAPGHPAYEPMMLELHRVFNAYNLDGHVNLKYETELYWGDV